MSRGRRFTSLESYEKALKDGVGIGSGENYQPWIRPQDFKQSTGIRSAIRGLKTFRQHNTLSSIESEFYYLAEFNDAVIDTGNILNANYASWMGLAWNGFHSLKWSLYQRHLKLWAGIEKAELERLQNNIDSIETLTIRAGNLPVK